MSTFENDAQSPKKGYLSKGKVCFLIQNLDGVQRTQKSTYYEKFNDLCKKNNIENMYTQSRLEPSLVGIYLCGFALSRLCRK